MKLIVNKNKCPQNHKCPSIRVCPKNAITQKNIFSLPDIDKSICILCGKCIKLCPKGAFEKIN
ncbi:MAG: 4Fe-4S ferredoxin [Clostridiales bacterium]|nr:MAG: 4Fe-4S ferredoxin [Clostridiales bacterium]